jgi:pimeloyl-ACP methyl ester carboxylesterase
MAEDSSWSITRRSVIGMALAGALAGQFEFAQAAAPSRASRLRREYARSRFGQLHYRLAKPTGSAASRPLLCLHSSPFSGRIFDQFLPAIGADRMAIAPDTPGFGDSDPPLAQPAIADYAAGIGDLIDSLQLNEIDVLGSRTGALIAAELGLQRPRQVRRVVMVSAPILTDSERAGLRAQFAPVTLRRSDPGFAEAWTRYVSDAWFRYVEQSMPGWSLDDLAEQFPDTLRRPDISWWGRYAALAYPLAERLPALRQPTLVLNPEDDLHQATTRAQPLLKNGRIQALPGWKLGFLDVRAVETAKLVRDFLGTAG